jgi:transposase
MSAAQRQDSKADFLARRWALHPHPERVRDALFRGSLFFDARDMIQVRYEMVRRHRIDGQSVPQVARSFGVSRQSVYLSIQTSRDLGLPGLFPRKRGPKSARKCTDVVLAFVRARLSPMSPPTLGELIAAIREHLGIRLHRRTLERQLAALGKKLCRANRPSWARIPRPST